MNEEQPNLIDPWTNEKRPTRSHPSVKQRAAAALAEDVYPWLKSHKLRDDDLIDTLLMHWDYCGYDFAKKLDSYEGISPDRELVDILESAGCHLHHAHQRAMRQWATANKITCPFKVGDHVSVMCGGMKTEKAMREGILVRIEEGEATVCVSIPEFGHMGHLPEAEQHLALDTTHRCPIGQNFNYEDLKPCH